MIDCIHQKKPRKLAKERDIGVGWGAERERREGERREGKREQWTDEEDGQRDERKKGFRRCPASQLRRSPQAQPYFCF